MTQKVTNAKMQYQSNVDTCEVVEMFVNSTVIVSASMFSYPFI